MKVTGLRHHIVHPDSGKNLCFVRIDTDEGLHGWGECYTQGDRDVQITAHLDALARYVIGRDPTRVRQLTQGAYDDFAARRGGMDYYCAISGIEQALWDIVGKAAGMPVYSLLGGACRDAIRVYANGWSGGARTPAELGEKAKAVAERGFTAMKFDPVPGPWRTFVDKTVERRAIDNVYAVRDAVGDEVDILIEMHRRLAPMHAVRIARAIEDAAPFWFEEPVLAQNVPALARAKRDIHIPVVTGEALYTKFDFREVFETAAADIINPDVCKRRRNPGTEGDRRHGRGVFRCRLAAQLQQHDRRPRRDPSRVRGDAELPDHRVFRQFRSARRGESHTSLGGCATG